MEFTAPDAVSMEKYEQLRALVAEAGKVALAFSGGVDSSFLLKVCFDVLGEHVLAITARSESFPAREVTAAADIARFIGCRHMFIETREMDLPEFSDNPPYRCYLCKRELFGKIKEIAEAQGISTIFDGSNADDAGDFRPGRRAAKEASVRSPLEEVGLTKKDIRGLSRMLGLPNWERAPFACLASRFPYRTKITASALRQVEQAEQCLWNMGMRVFRVRHHGDVARIELGEQEMRKLWELSLAPAIVKDLKSLGYTYVALDLEGYRTGSMNEALDQNDLHTGLAQSALGDAS